MSVADIIANNELIAKFMGVKIGEDNFSWRPGTIETLRVDHLGYHKEWGWLMPVIDKIEEYKFEDGDNAHLRTFSNGMVRINRFALRKEETKIMSAYCAVVDFIKWYNENNK